MRLSQAVSALLIATASAFAPTSFAPRRTVALEGYVLQNKTILSVVVADHF